MPERETLLLRGVLDLCVLALLAEQPVHGYEIAARLGARGLPAAAGSIYPLLARLEGRRLIVADERPSDSGPPRRAWRLTDAGGAELTAGRTVWRRMSTAIDSAIGSTPGRPAGTPASKGTRS